MEKNAKHVLHVEINDDVRKLTIEGTDKEQHVVMRQELDEDELDYVTGGLAGKAGKMNKSCHPYVIK